MDLYPFQGHLTITKKQVLVYGCGNNVLWLLLLYCCNLKFVTGIHANRKQTQIDTILKGPLCVI